MGDESKRARSLFLEAIEKYGPEQWPGFLDQVCADDSALREQVEGLLRAHSQLGSFHEAAEPLAMATLEAAPIAEGPGTVIGPYKLLEPIGEGGFGVVFMAEQHEPVRRKVALKVLKPGMDTRQVVARFEAERQALAVMEHANIARVFDGGQTPSGRPYFVMELVRGTPVTAFCDQNYLPIRERLELFVKVCQAVQHAHQKGIIHRDLKPSNVLIASHDGTPVPKVIDFGIAKALSGHLTDKTLFTGFAQMLGTPLYMSPEQAGQSSLDVDTRSDIYSLGVVLYELLTGTTPFDKEELSKLGNDEMRRIIREEEPPKPSTRISELSRVRETHHDGGDTLAEGDAGALHAPYAIAAQRQSDPKRLSQLLRGELDWIVMKALEKDRNRRYESASAFAADVQRYLQDEPVLACPPSLGYRLRKLVRRNKMPLAVAGLVLFFLFLLGGGIGWMAGDRAARQRATERQVGADLREAELALEKGNSAEAQKALARASGIISSEGLSVLVRQGWDKLAADLKMVATLEEIRTIQSQATPPSPATSSGDWYYNLPAANSEYARAFQQYGIDVESLTIEEAATTIQQRAIRLELLAALDAWAEVRRRYPVREDKQDWKHLLAVARAVDADALRHEVRDAWEKKDVNSLRRLAASEKIAELPASALFLLGRFLEERGAIEQAIALLRKAQRKYPGDFWINQGLGYFLMSVEPPRWQEAIPYYTAALAIRPESAGACANLSMAAIQKQDWDWVIDLSQHAIRHQPDYVPAHFNMGIAFDKLNRQEEAIAAYRKTIELHPRHVGAHQHLGLIFAKKGELDEATVWWKKALPLYDRRDPRQKRDCAITCYELGNVYRSKKEFDEALAWYQQAVDQELREAPLYHGLGLAYHEKGKIDKASKWTDKAIAALKAAVELKPEEPVHWHDLGNAYVAAKLLAKAREAFETAVKKEPTYASAWCRLGIVYDLLKEKDQAVAAYRKAIQFKPEFAQAHSNLGALLLDKGLLEEALEHLQLAIKHEPNSALYRVNFGSVFFRKGDYAEALAEYRKALELGFDEDRQRLLCTDLLRTSERLVEIEAKLAQPSPSVKIYQAKLTNGDPFDRLRKKSPHKVHEVAMQAGKDYRIELVSPDFYTHLRVEDATKKTLAGSDDAKRKDMISMVLFRPSRAETYFVVVASQDVGPATGRYFLSIEELPEGAKAKKP